MNFGERIRGFCASCGISASHSRLAFGNFDAKTIPWEMIIGGVSVVCQ